MTQDYECLDVTKGEIRDKLTTIRNEDELLLSQVSESDIFFAKERLGLHRATPEEGVSLQVLKNYIHKKYGI